MTDLRAEAFRRHDERPDPLFYLQPRFVAHIDDAAAAAVTQLNREIFPAGGAVLDLRSIAATWPLSTTRPTLRT